MNAHVSLQMVGTMERFLANVTSELLRVCVQRHMTAQRSLRLTLEITVATLKGTKQISLLISFRQTHYSYHKTFFVLVHRHVILSVTRRTKRFIAYGTFIWLLTWFTRKMRVKELYII